LGTYIDISERKQAEEALRESKNLFHDIAANYPNSYLSIIEPDMTIGFTAGQEFAKQNLNPNDFVGLTLEQVFGDQAPKVRKQYSKSFQGEEVTFELFINNQHQLYKVVPLKVKNGTISRILAVVENITERKKAAEDLRDANQRLQMQLVEIKKLQTELQELAIRDPLTGLFNRRYLQETMQRELDRALREVYPVCLVMADIDRFKRVNDTFGHAAGDMVLISLADQLSTQTRSFDIVCRYGGEEFLLVLPNLSIGAAFQRAEQWRSSFEASKVIFEEKAINTSISLGIAEFPVHGRTSVEVITAADSALYKAKAGGRNRIEIHQYDPSNH
jgi:diguanylate cyclase (GGDEF)-like protein